MTNSTNKETHQRVITGISNIKGNSYDIILEGKKYHITLEKGKREVDYSFDDDGNPIETICQPFHMKVDAPNKVSFVMYFHFIGNGYIFYSDPATYKLESYHFEGTLIPFRGVSTKELKDKYKIDLEGFYKKAFKNPFSVKMPASFKTLQQGKDTLGSELWTKILRESGTIEDITYNYLHADEIYAHDAELFKASVAEYKSGLKALEKEKAKNDAEIFKLKQERQRINKSISALTKSMNSKIAAYQRQFDPMVIQMAEASQKKRSY